MALFIRIVQKCLFCERFHLRVARRDAFSPVFGNRDVGGRFTGWLVSEADVFCTSSQSCSKLYRCSYDDWNCVGILCVQWRVCDNVLLFKNPISDCFSFPKWFQVVVSSLLKSCSFYLLISMFYKIPIKVVCV